MGNEGDAAKAANVARLVARAATLKTSEYPNWASSHTSGAIPMTLMGRFRNERERLGPEFTEVDRQWRIKWHKDQVLHPSEPRHVPALEQEYYNPIRKFSRAPLDLVERKALVPMFGAEWGKITRIVLGKGTLFYIFGLYMWYTTKYNHNDWERWGGWRVKCDKSTVLPGDPAYPLPNQRPNPEDYNDHGFKDRKVFRD